MSVLKHDDKRKPIVCYCSLTNWKQAEKLRDFLWGCIVYALKQESLSRIKILIEQKQSSVSCEIATRSRLSGTSESCESRILEVV